MAKALPKVRMTKEQREWCRRYKAETTFEPLMDGFLYGNESFIAAARFSVLWFEDWSSDAHLNVSRDIPGMEEEMMGEARADSASDR